MKMPDEIYAEIEYIGVGGESYGEIRWWNIAPSDGATKYIREDIHEEKMEVLRRIISGLEADIRKLKGK